MADTQQTVLAGRYRLVDQLGRGGMGTVWRAHDELLGRDVAVKEVLLPPGVDDETRDDLLERTKREARAAARLNHPNVVTVFDVVDFGGRPWIVMELVKSRGLNQIVRDDGPLSPERTASIGVQLLNALGVAHASGIFHRDVKPSNVLVADNGRVVLADFGIASVQGDPAMTRSGLILGSPSYIAPERARGLQAGPASDLWAVGATLYTAVEGRPPYDRDGIVPILTAAAMEDPDPFRLAGPLGPVLTALLQREPEKRPPIDEARLALRQVALMGPSTAPARGRSPKQTAVLPLEEIPGSAPPFPRTAPESAQSAAAVRPTSGGVAKPISGAPISGAPISGAPNSGAPISPTSGGPAGPISGGPVGSVSGSPVGSVSGGPVGAGSTATPSTANPSTATPESEMLPDEAAAFGVEPVSPPVGSPPVGSMAVGSTAVGSTPVEGAAGGPPAAGKTYNPGRNRTYAVMAAVLAAVVLLAVVAIALVNRGNDDDKKPNASQPTSSAPSTKASATGKPSPSSASTPSAAAPTGGTTTGGTAIPAGWHKYTGPGGYTIGVPDGWSVQNRADGVAIQNYQGPFLLIQTSDDPKSDPVADWEGQEPSRRSSVEDYQRISIQKVTYRGWNTADWVFQFTKNGTRRQVLNRGFVASSTQAYGMYWETDASQYSASLATFQTFANTFQPAPTS